MSETTIWINARFLGRTLTGVERVAYELISALCDNTLDKNGRCVLDGVMYRFKLIAPKSVKCESPWPEITLVKKGLLNGHAWEQIDLPRFTAGQMLLSLCNTGPLFKRRHVIYLHDAQPFAIPENFSLAFRSWYRIMFRIAGRSAKHILVNSKFTRSELQKHVGIDPARTTLVYPAANQGDDTNPDTVLSKYTIPDKPFILAVSSANPNKNFRSVLDALEILGDNAPPCVFVGSRQQKQFSDINLDWSKTTHLGYVSDEELQALYKKALCLVFPSFYEGFGLPPLEAMTAGCPVIVSSTGSLPEVSTDAAIYCDPNDSSTLAKGITSLQESGILRSSMIERGRARSNAFSWSRSADTLLNRLHELSIDQTDSLSLGTHET